jgi:hypothetical protein
MISNSLSVILLSGDVGYIGLSQLETRTLKTVAHPFINALLPDAGQLYKYGLTPPWPSGR